jgi:single-strand selective monofunctional uracil DNA glycosylase
MKSTSQVDGVQRRVHFAGVKLVRIGRQLADRCDALSFTAPVAHVYNPLRYARRAHESYLKRYGTGTKEAVFLGMNPGPWGMAQTGVPFGEVHHVRDYLGIDEPVKKPPQEHPKRPIQGFDCQRSEVSGRRLWSWAKERYPSADEFFERFFVINYCPLAFLEDSGRNRTPDKLPAKEREPLVAACDDALRKCIATLKPRIVVGIGVYAEKAAKRALADTELDFGVVLHPSPASPKANRGWAPQATADLERCGIQW